MGLYKRNSSQFYWMSFRVNSRRIFESTETTNKKMAEKIYAKRLTEITEGKWFPNEARKRTFEEVKERYMAEHSKIYKTFNSLKVFFLASFGNHFPSVISVNLFA